MQINRLFEIVYLLMNKEMHKAADLAAHFEVSRRTILRDIDTLAQAGIPVYTTQGKGGGIFLTENFTLDKAVFSENEQKQLLFSLQGIPGLLDNDKALGRLKSLFGKPREAAKDWIDVDFSRWGHSLGDNEKFEQLKTAILNERAISFNYIDANGETKGRQAYPLKLSFKSKAWYLHVFFQDANDYRVLKFTRLSGLTVLDEFFDSSNYQTNDINIEEEPKPKNFITVTVRVSPHALYRVYDEIALSEITENADGTLTIAFEHAPWLCDYLLSFGPAIEVIAPQNMRDKMLARLRLILQKYVRTPGKT